MLTSLRLLVAKHWRLTIAAGITLLFGLVLWKNHHSYRDKSKKWKTLKSLVDTSLILAATRLPAILVSWCVVWLALPIKNHGLKVTVTVLSSVLFGLLVVYQIELIVLLSIPAVDLISGQRGLLGEWEKAIAKRRASRVVTLDSVEVS